MTHKPNRRGTLVPTSGILNGLNTCWQVLKAVQVSPLNHTVPIIQSTPRLDKVLNQQKHTGSSNTAEVAAPGFTSRSVWLPIPCYSEWGPWTSVLGAGWKCWSPGLSLDPLNQNLHFNPWWLMSTLASGKHCTHYPKAKRPSSRWLRQSENIFGSCHKQIAVHHLSLEATRMGCLWCHQLTVIHRSGCIGSF